jgi:hypothetical protein
MTGGALNQWVCFKCEKKCFFIRETEIPPERCVYNERGNDIKALWIKSRRI